MSGCELYFWKDGEVVVRSWAHGPGLIFNRLCVDTSETVPELRYGQFSNGWKHCKYEELPAEFRVHLLLMGVS